jgi:hypothetical protein
MTCASADWSQRRFPVESGRTAAVSATSPQNKRRGFSRHPTRESGPDRSCHRLLGACTLRHTRVSCRRPDTCYGFADIRPDLKPAVL